MRSRGLPLKTLAGRSLMALSALRFLALVEPLGAQTEQVRRITLMLGGSPYQKSPPSTDLGIMTFDAASGQPAHKLIVGNGPDFDIPVAEPKLYRVDVWQGGVQIGQQVLSIDPGEPGPVPLTLFPKAELQVRVVQADGATPLAAGFVVEIYDRKDPADPVVSQMGLQSRVVTNAEGLAAYSYVFPTHYSGGNGYTVVVRDATSGEVVGRSTNVQVAPGGSLVAVPVVDRARTTSTASTAATASTAPTPSTPSATPARVVAIDLKTRAADKVEFNAIVTGVAAHTTVADWVKVKEFGEDYSVWLGALKRLRRGDLIVVQLVVELRTPASVNAGRQLASRGIEITYPAHEGWNGDPAVRDVLERRWRALRLPGLQGKRQEMMSEALFVGERVLQTIQELVARN